MVGRHDGGQMLGGGQTLGGGGSGRRSASRACRYSLVAPFCIAPRRAVIGRPPGTQ